MQIIKYDKKYKKEIPELFTNTIHKTCNKNYTKEQLNAWVNLDIDYDAWEKRLNETKAKPFFEKYGFKVVKKNIIKRDNQLLINYSMTFN